MKAGRELDALIHEKIFGKCGHVLAVYKKDNKNAWMDDYTNYRCKKCKTETFRGLAYREGMTVCPNYSTKIADSWLVVEKLRELGTVDLMDDDGNGWQVSILKKYNSIYTIVEAETAPLAICLASLKAVGVDIDGV